jgi:2-dehydro-3-deoxy-D-arabinonate dehydratase
MKLYRTSKGVFVEENDKFYLVPTADWDELCSSPDLYTRVRGATGTNAQSNFDPATVLGPVVSQEVWAAGVTYYRSRNARIDESKDSGGGSFYDRVYAAERPELFFKATGRRVVGPGGAVRGQEQPSVCFGSEKSQQSKPACWMRLEKLCRRSRDHETSLPAFRKLPQ